MSAWIRVDSDRRSHGELVDIFCKGRNVRVTNCTYDCKTGGFYHHQKGYIGDATHWMPRPDPPSE